ncbi:hypothetical protein VARIO8X_60292 [Burkholderiales bacterium 8X]|nr:hypothetical protein VARIO8X_60292 [Burkholderiales bacterium 8X]
MNESNSPWTPFAEHAQRARQIDHDLRTPLGTIASALALMEAAPDDTVLRAEALQVIARQVGRITGVAEQLRRHVDQLENACQLEPREASAN